MRWFNYVRSTGPFVKILGEVKFCGKEGVAFGQKKEDEKKPENKIEKATAWFDYVPIYLINNQLRIEIRYWYNGIEEVMNTLKR